MNKQNKPLKIKQPQTQVYRFKEHFKTAMLKQNPDQVPLGDKDTKEGKITTL